MVQTGFFPSASGDSIDRFYKVTHHCSVTGDNASFFAAYPAKWAATSCGTNRKYNHPENPPKTEIDKMVMPFGRHRITRYEKRTLGYEISDAGISEI